MAFNSRLLNLYRTDCNTIFNIVVVSPFYIITFPSLATKLGGRKLLKEGEPLSLNADLAF